MNINIMDRFKVTGAIKVASGLKLPVSDFLNGAKSYLGEELANRRLDEGGADRRCVTKKLVGKAYEELKQLIEEQECKHEKLYVHFTNVMQLVDDGDGEKV